MSQVHDALKRAAGDSDRNRNRQSRTRGILKEDQPSRPSMLSLFVIVLLLGLAFGALYFWSWWKARRPLPGSVGNARSAAPITQASAPQGAEETETSSPASQATSAPPSAAEGSASGWPSDFKLIGIIYSKTKPVALINDQAVGVGDVINGIKVVKIERTKVTLQRGNGQTTVLELR